MQLGFLTDGRGEDVAFATRHGFDCLELALFGDTAMFDHHRTFKWTLLEHGNALAAVSLFGQNFCHPDSAERQKFVERLRRVIDLAAALGAPVAAVGGTFVADPNPGLGDIRWEEFFGILYHVGYDRAVCIEPHSAIYTGPRRYKFLKLSGRYLRRFFPEPVGA